MLSSVSYGASLKDVYDVAVKKDPLLSSADYQRYATRGDKSDACGKLFPQLTLKSSYVDYEQDEAGSVLGDGTANTNGAISGNQSSVGVTLEQSIIDLPKLADCRMWRASVSRDDANYEIAKEDLIYRVIVTYLDVLSAKSNYEYSKGEVKLYRALKKETDVAFSNKVNTQREVNKLNAKLNNAKANKISAENNFIAAKERLKSIFDRDIANDKLLVIKDNVTLTLVESASPEHWAEVAEQSNLNLIRSQLSEQVLRYDVKSEQAKYLPTVDVFANHTDYDSDIDRNGVASADNGHFSTETVGVRLNWKLFAGGSNRGRVKAAKNRYLSAQKQLEYERDIVRLNAKNTSRGLIALSAKVDASASLLKAAKSDYDAVKTGTKSRIKTKTDLLEATLNVLDAQAEVNNARYEYVKGVLEFWKSIGSLSMDNISQIDALFIEPKEDIIQMSDLSKSGGRAYQGKNLMELLKDFSKEINNWMSEDKIKLFNNSEGNKNVG